MKFYLRQRRFGLEVCVRDITTPDPSECCQASFVVLENLHFAVKATQIALASATGMMKITMIHR